jgi:hypothetical protein
VPADDEDEEADGQDAEPAYEAVHIYMCLLYAHILLKHICVLNVINVLFGQEAEQHQLVPRQRYPPWAFGKGKGKGGHGGRLVDAHGGQYVMGGCVAVDGDFFE